MKEILRRSPLLRMTSILIDAIFPPRCVLCDQVAESPKIEICAPCAAGIRWLPEEWRSATVAEGTVSQILAAAQYEGALKDAICRLKYERRLDLVRSLVQVMMTPILPRLKHPIDAVVSVPLGRARLRERGYNQAALIGDEVARLIGRPHLKTALRRTRETVSQVGLGSAERRQNLQGAFQLCPAAEPVLRGKSVLLVDDVLTTGATLLACAEALRAPALPPTATHISALTLAAA